MKHLNTIIIVLLNVLFCSALLWFYSQNAFLRPYAGSTFKEVAAGLLLLGSLYAHYFLLYPKLYLKHSPLIYWSGSLLMALVTGLMELGIAYKNIVLYNAMVLQDVGGSVFFSIHLFFVAGRNLLLSFFPFLLRERQHFQQAFENEVKVVYQNVRKLDVVDGQNNIQLVSIDDIFYCQQQRNYTDVYLVQNKHYTRTCSMKHLEQLFGEDFIRITTTVLVPFQYIKACNDYTVIMKKMPWEEEHTKFQLEPKNQEEIAERVVEGLLRHRAKAGDQNTPDRPARQKRKRKLVTPPDKKLTAVLSYIKRNTNCNSNDIVDETKIPLSTVERCIAVLKKQGLIEHSGSKKTGGYRAVTPPPKSEATETD